MSMSSEARRRSRLRLWLLVGFAPFALVGLLVVVKILSMYAFAHSAVSSHVRDDPAGTVSAAQGQAPLNWFDPYKAPYNLGVGLATLDRLDEARAQFEEALPLASGYDACPIHINLALVVEMMGDRARVDDPQAAPGFYAEALELNLATPEECRDPEADEQSPDPDRSNEETLDEQQERLREQQQGRGDDEDSDEDEQDEEEQDQEEQDQEQQQDQLDEIEERLEQGAEQREQQLDDEDEDGAGGSERPW